MTTRVVSIIEQEEVTAEDDLSGGEHPEPAAELQPLKKALADIDIRSLINAALQRAVDGSTRLTVTVIDARVRPLDDTDLTALMNSMTEQALLIVTTRYALSRDLSRLVMRSSVTLRDKGNPTPTYRETHFAASPPVQGGEVVRLWADHEAARFKQAVEFCANRIMAQLETKLRASRPP